MTEKRKPPKSAEVIEADEMLMVNDAAALLNCSSPQIYRMANAGQIPALKVGSMLRIPKQKFLKWMADNTTGVSVGSS